MELEKIPQDPHNNDFLFLFFLKTIIRNASFHKKQEIRQNPSLYDLVSDFLSVFGIIKQMCASGQVFLKPRIAPKIKSNPSKLNQTLDCMIFFNERTTYLLSKRSSKEENERNKENLGKFRTFRINAG